MSQFDIAINKLEEACERMYTAGDASQRGAAEQVWNEFCRSSNFLSRCFQLLERNSSVYVQMVALTTLVKVICAPVSSSQLTVEERVALKDLLLNILFSNPKMPNYLQQAYIHLYSVLIKFGWFDTRDSVLVFHDLINETNRFLNGTQPEQVIIGLQLLTQVVSVVNQPDGFRSMTRYRRVAANFRDEVLFDIFKTGVKSATTVRDSLIESGSTLAAEDTARQSYVNWSLRLTQACLNFDFLGMMNDESSDDVTIIQVPLYWKSFFCDQQGSQNANIRLFFELYHLLPPSLASACLAILASFVCVRRSLFDPIERERYLRDIMSGIRTVLENPEKLNDPQCYHEFCRMLSNLKSNFQLHELVMVDFYPDFIKSVAAFSVSSLKAWQFSPNSVHFLLGFWQRLVASLPYLKTSDGHFLQVYVPEVVAAYITARVKSVESVISSNGVLDDPLDDASLVEQQLDLLTTIVRCEYEKTCQLVSTLFNDTVVRYNSLPNAPSSAEQAANAAQVIVGEFTWLVYIIGCMIGGRVPFACSDEHDTWDGELISRVVQLMRLTDRQLEQSRCDEKLELSLLFFLEQFRRVFVGDQIHKSSKLYQRLSDVLNLDDESRLLMLFVDKIIRNLRYASHSNRIVAESLKLFEELSVGYTAMRKLVSLDTVQFLLRGHVPENFPFLAFDRQPDHMKCRSTFYQALGRLVSIDLMEDADDFLRPFLQPLTTQFEKLSTAIQLHQTMDAEATKRIIIALARDMYGLAFVFTSKAVFAAFFDWMYPKYLGVFLAAVQMWPSDSNLTIPIFKMLAELVQNRQQRLQFELSNPGPYLLFRELSRFICTFVEKILQMADSIPESKVYKVKLKPLMLCLSAMRNSLYGQYINFGVFQLYHDPAFDNALSAIVHILHTVPETVIAAYPKLAQEYYRMLESLAVDHVERVASFELTTLRYMFNTITDGLLSLDAAVSTLCCAVLDHLLTYVYKKMTKLDNNQQQQRPGSGNTSSSHPISFSLQSPNVQTLSQRLPIVSLLVSQPHYLQQLLASVLNAVMFEDCKNLWSMSRPLLALILLNENYYQQLKQETIAMQSEHRQQAIARCFSLLMEDVERNLSLKNRDRFTQNLNVFRRELVDCLRSPAQAGTSNSHSNGGGLTVPGTMGITGSPGSIDSIDSDELPPVISQSSASASFGGGPGHDVVFIKFLDPPVFTMPLPVMSIFPASGSAGDDKFESLF